MPYYGFYGIDMYYIVLVVPCIILAFWAQARVKSTFNRYSQVLNRRGLTGAQAAEAVLRQNGVTGVRVEWVAGKLTDHFDPRTNTIRLSNAVYSSTSVASVGVAAHEAGHAVQYAVGYFPIRLRAAGRAFRVDRAAGRAQAGQPGGRHGQIPVAPAGRGLRGVRAHAL